MAFKVYDRVKETSSTAGSGTLTLAGAVNGFQAFSDVYSNGDTTHYVIVNAREWETGLGTYSSGTLSRDTVFESSNNDQFINIAGASTIFVSYPASKTVLAQNGLTHSGVPYINASGHLNDNAGLVYDYTNQNLTVGGNVSANSGVVNVLDLNPISAPAYQEGLAYYDTDNKSITVYNDESEISLQVGQEEYIRIRNNSGSTIANGEAVRITGSQGTHTTVEKAIANDKTKSEAIGLATHDIENNSFGYITTFGLVRELNTNAFNEGDEVFLSAAASGSLTGVAPIAPNYEMSIGHVVRKHSSQGSILVTPGIRKLGGSDVKTLTTPDVKGVTFYTANSTSTAGILSSNPDFVYESGDKHLGLNQTSPDAALHASPSTTTEPAAIFEAVPAQTSNLTEWHDTSGNAVAYVTSAGDAHFNNLMVTGVTTYVNTNTLTVQDKNIELASVSGSALGNDAIADGGGITLLSSDGNKTITWNDSSNSWNFNQNIDIDNGYSLSVNDYTLPSSDGSGNYIIKTDGSGNLNFVDIGTLVSAADPSGSVQFNDGGAFGGDANFTWDGTNLVVGTNATPASMNVIGPLGTDVTTPVFSSTLYYAGGYRGVFSHYRGAREKGFSDRSQVCFWPSAQHNACLFNGSTYGFVLSSAYSYGISSGDAETIAADVTLGRGSSGGFEATSTVTTSPVFVIKTPAAHTDNSLEIQNSATTPLVVVDASGYMGVGTASPSGQLDVVGASTSQPVLSLTMPSGHADNAFEVQDYTGSVKASIGKDSSYNFKTQFNEDCSLEPDERGVLLRHNGKTCLMYSGFWNNVGGVEGVGLPKNVSFNVGTLVGTSYYSSARSATMTFSSNAIPTAISESFLRNPGNSLERNDTFAIHSCNGQSFDNERNDGVHLWLGTGNGSIAGTATEARGGNVYIALGAGAGTGAGGAFEVRTKAGSALFQVAHDGQATFTGDVAVSGHFSATTKSFLIDHPTKDGKLQYASLEGPENGVYVRGTTNEGEITLPDYWSALVHEDSITVSLTSVGEFQPLYVESKFVDKITVGGATGHYDYVVYAERKDVPKLEVEKWE